MRAPAAALCGRVQTGAAGYPRHDGDAGPGFAAKTQGSHGFQVGDGGQLAGSVMPESQGQFAGGDAAAVVGDADFGHAAAADGHGDAGGSGVQGILNQFLDHRGGVLNDFAGGDLCGSCRMGIGLG